MQPEIQKLLQSFFIKYKLGSFAKGEIIFKPYQSRRIFLLTQGVVRMFAHRGSSELTLNIYKPYAIFPMSLALNNQKDRYGYAALTNAEGYFAPKKEFTGFLNKNPQIALDLLARIYRGLDGFFMRLEALLSGDAYIRILTQLIIYARRFGQDQEGRMIFDWHLTHQELSSQTGLARETVTKMIKILQSKHLIGYLGKKIFIYDLAKLEEEFFLKSPLDKNKKL